MSKVKKIGIAVAAVFVVVIAVSAITYQIAPPASSATDAQQIVADEYTKTDASQSYVRDGEECMGYRVAVSATATEEQLLSVFEEVVAGDGYPMHTVWFYSSVDKAQGGDQYDVAMVEEESAGGDPVVTMA